MDSKRGNWSSNIGFLLAAIGSAVGLGNIWGFPYKMGKSGGFWYLLIYIVLAVLVGFTIMISELALGRKVGKGVVGTYGALSKKFSWIAWLAMFAPFVILSFYTVLGGYCIEYMTLNMADLSFGLQSVFNTKLSGAETFEGMLTNPFGSVIFTALFIIICYLINKGGVSEGIEKFNKIGMPALFVMLIIIIIRSVTLPNAVEGLKFMFIPGYAVSAGFIEKAPSFITILSVAGGQMFFSLSLAMGVMVTYGSYLNREENLVKNSVVIVFADTLVALFAGLAVIPAAVGNGISNGIPLNEISLGGPKLLFVTLQDVFSQMGKIGPLFGIIFYLLVLVAAISSAISLMEVTTTFFVDRATQKGRNPDRAKINFWVSFAIFVEAVLVAIDGLGSTGIFKWGTSGWNDCMLDFMDCWSEGIAMPLGAFLMSIMVGWELKPNMIFEECKNGFDVKKGFKLFFTICIKYVVPVIMLFILLGQVNDFFKVGIF